MGGKEGALHYLAEERGRGGAGVREREGGREGGSAGAPGRGGAGAQGAGRGARGRGARPAERGRVPHGQ